MFRCRKNRKIILFFFSYNYSGVIEVNMKKEDLLELKRLLCYYYEQTPKKLSSSVVMVGAIDVFTASYALINLFNGNEEEDVIIKSLLASGATTGILAWLIKEQISLINNSKEEKVKQKIRK